MVAGMSLRTPLTAALLAAALSASAVASASGPPVPAGPVPERPDIVGGTEAPDGAYPFTVVVRNGGSYCAGSLLAPTWVLTAAHCVDSDGDGTHDAVSGIWVYAGSNQHLSGGEQIDAAAVYEHPGYNEATAPTFADDLALIELESPTTLGLPILWATPDDAALYPAGTIATVVGWGLTQNDPPGSSPFDALREVGVPIVSDAYCDGVYNPDPELPPEFDADAMICAGDLDDGKDSCSGDSGGPLFIATDDWYLHVGIVSWGPLPCADPVEPGVYTRTASYADWIESTTGLSAADTCDGMPANVVGSAGADVLAGRGGRDVIQAGGGDDLIEGKASGDVICAGTGDDEIRGGSGDDVVGGGGGADTIYGGNGDDDLTGGGGADTIFGHVGQDTLTGGPGNDTLWGGLGADTLWGGTGFDVMYGEELGDTLDGGDGDDTMWGGTGNDDLFGSADDDEIRGGDGSDNLDGGDGIDVLRGGAGAVDTCLNGEDVIC